MNFLKVVCIWKDAYHFLFHAFVILKEISQAIFTHKQPLEKRRLPIDEIPDYIKNATNGIFMVAFLFQRTPARFVRILDIGYKV